MKTQLAIFSATILLFFTACNNQQATTTTEQTPEKTSAPSQAEQIKEAYMGIINAFETGNTDNLANYVSEEIVDHGEIPGINTTGVQRLKDMIAMWRNSFPDLQFGFHHIIAEGDMLIAHASFWGTNTGSFMGGPPTNRMANAEFIDVLRWANGKFVEHWSVEDNYTMFAQLGMIPGREEQATAPASAPTPENTGTAPPEQIAKMKAAYSAVANMIQRGDLSNLDQYLDSDFKEHVRIPGVTLPDGIEGARQAMNMWKEAYPDLKLTIDHVVVEGNTLISYFWMEGTYSGSIPDLPAEAAGKKVKIRSADIITFNAEGKAIAHREVTDHYSEMIQLGVIPPPGGEGQASAN